MSQMTLNKYNGHRSKQMSPVDSLTMISYMMVIYTGSLQAIIKETSTRTVLYSPLSDEFDNRSQAKTDIINGLLDHDFLYDKNTYCSMLYILKEI